MAQAAGGERSVKRTNYALEKLSGPAGAIKAIDKRGAKKEQERIFRSQSRGEGSKKKGGKDVAPEKKAPAPRKRKTCWQCPTYSKNRRMAAIKGE